MPPTMRLSFVLDRRSRSVMPQSCPIALVRERSVCPAFLMAREWRSCSSARLRTVLQSHYSPRMRSSPFEPLTVTLLPEDTRALYTRMITWVPDT